GEAADIPRRTRRVDSAIQAREGDFGGLCQGRQCEQCARADREQSKEFLHGVLPDVSRGWCPTAGWEVNLRLASGPRRGDEGPHTRDALDIPQDPETNAVVPWLRALFYRGDQSTGIQPSTKRRAFALDAGSCGVVMRILRNLFFQEL